MYVRCMVRRQHVAYLNAMLSGSKVVLEIGRVTARRASGIQVARLTVAIVCVVDAGLLLVRQ